MAICGLSNDKSGTVVSGRELYRVNGTSKIMDTDLFRRENVTEGTFIVGDAEFTIDCKYSKSIQYVLDVGRKFGGQNEMYLPNIKVDKLPALHETTSLACSPDKL